MVYLLSHNVRGKKPVQSKVSIQNLNPMGVIKKAQYLLMLKKKKYHAS